jgi:hypothetical protein
MCYQGASIGGDVGLLASGAGALTGNPLAIGALVASLAGTATQAYAQHQQLVKQDQITAQGIVQQGDIQKKAEGDVSNTVKTLNQSTADVNAKSAQQLGAYTNALKQASPIAKSDNPNVPGASSAFKAASASAQTSANDYTGAIAKSAATTQGTQLERVGEGQTIASTASDLGVLSNQSAESNYVTQLKVRATQQNPWLQAVSALAKGASIGMGAAAGAGFGGGSSTLPGAANFGSGSTAGTMTVGGDALSGTGKYMVNAPGAFGAAAPGVL